MVSFKIFFQPQGKKQYNTPAALIGDEEILHPFVSSFICLSLPPSSTGSELEKIITMILTIIIYSISILSRPKQVRGLRHNSNPGPHGMKFLHYFPILKTSRKF